MKISFSPEEKQKFYRFIDFVLVFFVGVFMVYYILGVRRLSVYYLLPIFLAFLWVLFLDGIGVYEYENLNNFKNSVIYLLLSLLFTGLLYGLMYMKFSGDVRRFLILHLGISVLSLISVRLILVKNNLFNKFKTKVVIASKNYERIRNFLKNYPEYEIAGIIEHNPVMTKENGKVLKKIEADEIILNYSRNSFESQELMKNLLKRGYRIKYFEDIYEKLTGRISLDFLENEAYLNRFLAEVKEDRFYDFMKRVFDIIGALIGGVIYIVLFPFIAIAVKLDSEGPLFYKHKRSGRYGKPFTIWKIRTMVKDAEKGKAVWAKRNDPRITRVGKILRKTRLDEFTQLFNILKGEMSAVGPRPERPELEEGIKKHIPHYDLRYLVKPGMAGWAMVNYDYVDSIEDAKIRQEYDLYYVKNRSFYLDFKIFLRALCQLLLFKGR